MLSKPNINLKIFAASLVGGGLIGYLIAWIFIYPHQLRLARGENAEILEWMETPTGQTLYRTFRKGNESTRECLQRRLQETGKIQCKIQIEPEK